MALYNEIEKLEYGVSANDGLGYDIRNGAMITDSNFRNIVLFITGGLREMGRIDNVYLPMSRGGTGASTVAGVLKNFSLAIGPNNEMLYGYGNVGIYDTKFTVYGKPSNFFAFSKVTAGKYRLEGPIKWGVTGYRIAYPKDELGNFICGCVIESIASGIDILTYKVIFDNGLYRVDLTQPIDIPPDKFISLNLTAE